MNPNLQLPITNYKLGLIGYPLGHSLSPKIHTAALQASGLEGNYSLFPIPPEDKQALQDLLAQVRAGEIHGLNVTIPHKQNVIEFMDELTPAAQAIGAVNTIYMRGDKLIGDNTDAPGFLADLKRFIGDWRLEILHWSSAQAVQQEPLYMLCSMTAGMSPSPLDESNRHNNLQPHLPSTNYKLQIILHSSFRILH